MEIVFIGLALSVCCFGIWRYGKTLRRGGCCGSGAVSPVKRRVADRDETHYPYTAVLTIDGMTCGHCAVRVENALNELNGVWAKVDLGGKTALVRMVQPLPEAVLRQAIPWSRIYTFTYQLERSSQSHKPSGEKVARWSRNILLDMVWYI